MRKNFLRMLAVVLAVSVLALPGTAHAWDRWGHGYGPRYYGPGIGVGVGLALGLGVGAAIAAAPPVYYAPPAYYAPPVVYSPAPVYAAPAGSTCYAGPYVCPLDQATPVGGGCSCPTNGNTRSYGRAR